MKKVSQYLAAGAKAVWLVYPALQLVEIQGAAGSHQVRALESLVEEALFGGGFSIPLSSLFDGDPYH